MSRPTSLFLLSLFLFSCESNSLSTSLDELEENEEKISAQKECTNNESQGECAIRLTSISYSVTDRSCMFDHLIEITTDFEAPAGLKKGSIARIEWEFTPKGNAGFWTVPISNSSSQTKGSLTIEGCFSYGSKDTLLIRRTITDHEGVTSNLLSINIEKPREKKSLVQNESEALIMSQAVEPK